MDSLLGTEIALVLAGLLFIALVAAQAFTKGVLGFFWVLLGLACGAFAGMLFFQHANALLSRWAPGWELGAGGNLFASVVIGLLVFLLARKITQSILQALFNPDGILSGWAGGFRGALFSLIPSILILILLAVGLRIAGTLAELSFLESLSRPDTELATPPVPSPPSLVRYRDALEALPFSARALRPIDPVGRPAERNLVGLVVLCRDPRFRAHLSTRPETADIVDSPAFDRLLADEELRSLVAENNHLALLRHPAIAAATADAELAEALAILDLPAMVREVHQARLEDRAEAEAESTPPKARPVEIPAN